MLNVAVGFACVLSLALLLQALFAIVYELALSVLGVLRQAHEAALDCWGQE